MPQLRASGVRSFLAVGAIDCCTLPAYRYIREDSAGGEGVAYIREGSTCVWRTSEKVQRVCQLHQRGFNVCVCELHQRRFNVSVSYTKGR